MASVIVIVPTLGRAARLRSVAENITATSNGRASVLFVLEKSDTSSVAAAQQADLPHLLNDRQSTYADCVNVGYRSTDHDVLVASADDVEFLDGWFDPMLASITADGAGVVGLHDCERPWSDHATHYALARSYLDDHGGCLDRAGEVLAPYAHNFTDWELVITAKVRGKYRYCEESRIRHHHPGWETDFRVREGDARFDPTYAKGNSSVFDDAMKLADRSQLFYEALREVAQSEADISILRTLGQIRRQRMLHRAGFSEAAIRHVITTYSATRRLLGLPT